MVYSLLNESKKYSSFSLVSSANYVYKERKTGQPACIQHDSYNTYIIRLWECDSGYLKVINVSIYKCTSCVKINTAYPK